MAIRMCTVYVHIVFKHNVYRVHIKRLQYLSEYLRLSSALSSSPLSFLRSRLWPQRSRISGVIQASYPSCINICKEVQLLCKLIVLPGWSGRPWSPNQYLNCQRGKCGKSTSCLESSHYCGNIQHLNVKPDSSWVGDLDRRRVWKVIITKSWLLSISAPGNARRMAVLLSAEYPANTELKCNVPGKL